MAVRLTHGPVGKLLAVGTLALLPILLFAYSGGPPDGKTGAPGEGLCTECHSGSPDDGSIQILGVPLRYQLGATYTVTVILQDQGQSRWGFELTAKNEAGDGVGMFTITDSDNTQLTDNPEPAADYVKHEAAGTYAGTANGPVSWKFDWTAPTTRLGDVIFYAAGNASNNDGSTSGDNIYSTSFTTALDGVPSVTGYGLAVIALLLLVSAVIVLRRRRAAAARH